MGERRRAAVRLLDGEFLEITVTPRLSVEDVLTLVSGHCKLTSPDCRYFGVAYVDDSGHYHWLQLEKRILDFEFPSKKAVIQLNHNVRFFVDSIFSLDNLATIELFFLEAHQQLLKEQLDLSDVDYVRVAGCLLQVYAGEYNQDISAVDILRTLLPYPRRLLTTYNMSQDTFEKESIVQYIALKSVQRGTAMINFMQIIERCSKYGSRFYRVSEKSGSFCLLAINSRGIHVYDTIDSFQAKKVFHWKFLDNLYYRDKKFSVEIRDARRIIQSSSDSNTFLNSSLADDEELARAVSDPTTQVSVSRRSLTASSIHIHTFTCDSTLLCKTIWSAAIAQHQFYLDQKSNLKRVQPLVGGLDHQELSEKLNRLVSKSSIGSSLPSLSSLHSSSSLSTMPSAKVADGSCTSLPSLKSVISQKSDEDRQRDIELYKQLKTKKAQLEEKLKMRLCELRSVCVREGELSGEMPKEMKRALLPGEELPKLKKRVGTAFSIPEEVLKADKADKISQLETDVELHRKIVAAAERLAKDKSMNKSVRKKRQKDLAAAALKLRGLELGLNQMRLSASKPDVSSLGSHETGNPWPTFPTNGAHLTRAVAKSCPTTPRGSVPDLCNQMEGEKSDYEDDEQIPRRAPSASSRRSFHQRFSEASTSSSSSMGLPPRANSRRSLATRSITSDELDNPLTIEQPPIYENVGYRSTSYRSSYRQAHYPTIQDDQHMRKRAQSVHVISQFEELGSKDNGSYNIPMEDATWKFKQDEKQSQYLNNDDDITPTIEHPAPLRKLPKSISCQEGFSTASLDRRAIRNRPLVSSSSLLSNEPRRDSLPMHGQSSLTNRITTFPVCSQRTLSDSRKSFLPSDLPRFQLPMGRPSLTHFPSRTALPQYNQISRGPASISAGRLPTQTDPHMEALLDYYKEQTATRKPPTPKTATIV